MTLIDSKIRLPRIGGSSIRTQKKARTASPASTSIMTYESADSQQELEELTPDPKHPAGWRGLNTPMPTPSVVNATRTPTRVFDKDFTPNEQDPYSLRHSEYGYDPLPAHRSVSEFKYRPGQNLNKRDEDDEPNIWIYLSTYISYALLISMGHLCDFFDKWFFPNEMAHLMPHNGYAPLFSDFDSFYTRRLKQRIDDLFARPVTGLAGRTITLLDRTTENYNSSFTFTGETTQALNVSSYNYLGFAQSRGPCADRAQRCVEEYGVAAGSSRGTTGSLDLHIQAERLFAAFLGVEDCMIVSTGFATNSTTLPALIGKGSLIISDELNHASIRFGARISGAMVRQFKHNDMEDLENLLRECISQGMPRTHRPWKKILVVVEGLYSMEGNFAPMPVLLELKEKYKFYLYIDEAHSVGAVGPRGRGVVDYFGCDPRKVDIMMGTFTKSFGAAGGYIAGSHDLIRTLRQSSHSELYCEAMPPPVISQIVTSTASIMGTEAAQYVPSLASAQLSPLFASKMDGREGLDRLGRLSFNCRYLHHGLKKLGFIVYGSEDSPIVPLLIFNPGVLPQFSRLLLERYRIVVVMAAYPATDLVHSRCRLCLSSAHTKQDLDRLLIAIDDIGGALGLKFMTPPGGRKTVQQVIEEGVESVRAVEAR